MTQLRNGNILHHVSVLALNSPSETGWIVARYHSRKETIIDEWEAYRL